jgi:hypothetical protein
MKLLPTLCAAFGFALAAVAAHAQTLELKAGNFNSTWIAPATAPVGSNQASLPATPNSNFQGMSAVSGASGPISTDASYGDRYPSNPANTIVLEKSTMGGAFASSPPAYFMGDEITPPLTNAGGQDLPGATPEEKLAAARLYWRPQPVLPGENLPLIGGILLPLGNVRVTAARTDSTGVTYSSAPAPSGLAVGATLLGQPITKITPTAITLAGNANETITGNSDRPITPATSFYYSRHADKVFAGQPGQVTITWVTKELNLSRTENFVVAASTRRPVRTIYWTEGSFDGPKVQIADARITTVNPVYYSNVPKAVPEEVAIPGYTPIIPNLNTLFFDKFNGIGQLHAHNVEGRILIEYLGNIRLGDAHESLGIDVVEIKRAPDLNLVSQNLGTELKPRVPLQDGDEWLVAPPHGPTARWPISPSARPVPPTTPTTGSLFPRMLITRSSFTGWRPFRRISASGGRSSKPATGSAGRRISPTMPTIPWMHPAALRPRVLPFRGERCRRLYIRTIPLRQRR